MKALLGITDRDISALKMIREVADDSLKDIEKKVLEDSGKWSSADKKSYETIFAIEDVLNKIICVAENQIELNKAYAEEKSSIREIESASEQENMGCEEPIRPYIRILSESMGSEVCVVEGDSLMFRGRIFRNKKLLPFDGSSVEVIEYADRIMVVTMKGIFVVALYKNCFRTK